MVVPKNEHLIGLCVGRTSFSVLVMASVSMQTNNVTAPKTVKMDQVLRYIFGENYSLETRICDYLQMRIHFVSMMS